MEKLAQEILEKLLKGELFTESSHEKYDTQGDCIARTVSRHQVPIPPKILERLWERYEAPKESANSRTWEVTITEVPYDQHSDDDKPKDEPDGNAEPDEPTEEEEDPKDD